MSVCTPDDSTVTEEPTAGMALPLYGLVLVIISLSAILFAVMVVVAILLTILAGNNKRGARKIEPQLLKKWIENEV
jgi:hypothetical protein